MSFVPKRAGSARCTHTVPCVYDDARRSEVEGLARARPRLANATPSTSRSKCNVRGMSYPQPPYGPPQGYTPPPAKTGCATKVLAAIGLFFAGSCVLGVIGARNAPHGPSQGNGSVPVAPGTSAPAAPSGPRWTYEDNRDEMRNATRHIACLTSTNRLSFRFPYAGGATGTICFRQTTGGSLDAWVGVDRGQMICQYPNCNISVKFDDRAVATIPTSRPSGGAHTMLFVDSSSTFLRSTRAAHRIMVEAEFYNEGLQQLVFDQAEGLVWNPPR